MLSTRSRVRETNSATGTASFALTGAVDASYQTWQSAFGVGGGARAVPYVAVTPTQWEAGYGYFNGSTLIARVAACVMEGSSGAGVLVNFSTAPEVFCDAHATMLNIVGTGPRAKLEIFEDFVGGFSGGTPVGGRLASGTSGSGASIGGLNATVGIAGSANLQTGTTSAGSAHLMLGTGNPAGNIQFYLGQGIWVAEANLRIPQTSNGSADGFDVRFGFSTTGNSDPSTGNGLFAHYGQVVDAAFGTSGHLAGRWFKGGVEQPKVDLGAWPDNTNFHRLRIEVNDDSSRADFLVDGVNVGNFTGDLPKNSNNGQLGFSIGIARSSGNANTASRTIQADYLFLGNLPTLGRL